MSIVDDWGPGEDDQDPLHLDQLSMARLSQLSFLFGGVGDGKVLYPSQYECVLKRLTARHVFGSIIGVNRAFQKLTEAKKTRFKVHMTLLDIHPMVLARDLCLFYFRIL